MEYTSRSVIYTADDEEPNCGICDNQDCPGRCEHCGAEYGWYYYEREEERSDLNELAERLKRLGLR